MWFCSFNKSRGESTTTKVCMGKGGGIEYRHHNNDGMSQPLAEQEESSTPNALDQWSGSSWRCVLLATSIPESSSIIGGFLCKEDSSCTFLRATTTLLTEARLSGLLSPTRFPSFFPHSLWGFQHLWFKLSKTVANSSVVYIGEEKVPQGTWLLSFNFTAKLYVLSFSSLFVRIPLGRS